jgi:hypothetical protein
VYGAGAFGEALRHGGLGHASLASATAAAGHRLGDQALAEVVGLRSALDPRAVVAFRARSDYLALIGEDIFHSTLPVRPVVAASAP